jgi:ribosomal protein L19E
MNLRVKKQLASRALKVGKERIIFVNERLDEIKEAITKQDIIDLHKDGAIKVREISGRKSKPKTHKKRTAGNVRKKVNTRKRDYIIMTRKLRKIVADLKNSGKINREEFKDLRKKIRNKSFKSKAQLKEIMGQRESSQKGSGKGKVKTKTARKKK